jgi:hypothetical protein
MEGEGKERLRTPKIMEPAKTGLAPFGSLKICKNLTVRGSPPSRRFFETRSLSRGGRSLSWTVIQVLVRCATPKYIQLQTHNEESTQHATTRAIYKGRNARTSKDGVGV